MRQPKTTGRLIKTQERRVFELDLRKSGMTYRQIAKATINRFGIENLPKGYDERYAYMDVKRELEKIRTQVAEDIEEIRQTEIERLDKMLMGLWPKAVKGDVSAVGSVLRIMERRSVYLGLDAPKHLILDWREKAKDVGIDPTKLFNDLVDAAAERMVEKDDTPST